MPPRICSLESRRSCGPIITNPTVQSHLPFFVTLTHTLYTLATGICSRRGRSFDTTYLVPYITLIPLIPLAIKKCLLRPRHSCSSTSCTYHNHAFNNRFTCVCMHSKLLLRPRRAFIHFYIVIILPLIIVSRVRTRDKLFVRPRQAFITF